MNKYYTLCFGFFVFFYILSCCEQVVAQPQELVSVTEQKFDKRQMTTITVSFEAESDEVIDAFDKHLRKAHKVKLKSGFFGGKNYTAEKATLTAVTPERIDLFVRIESKKGNTGAILYVAAAKGYDLIISPQRYPDEFDKLQVLVRNFAIEFNKAYYDKLIKEAAAALAAAEKEKQNLEKESENAKNKIVSLKKELENNENKIKENEPKIKQADEKIKQATENLERMRQNIGTN
ncbi:MAG: hypothetical protein JJT94_16445 [Bernardetiaceae bacterium]|nr:hypothetical protein [Bernardetiaceae bacterium]